VECEPSSQFYFGVEPEIQLDLRFLKKNNFFEKRVTRTEGSPEVKGQLIVGFWYEPDCNQV